MKLVNTGTTICGRQIYFEAFDYRSLSDLAVLRKWQCLAEQQKPDDLQGIKPSPSHVEYLDLPVEEERARRAYYQDIVYVVCNLLDTCVDGKVACGTADKPTTQVQETLKSLLGELKRIRRGQPTSLGLVAELEELVTKYSSGYNHCAVIGALEKVKHEFLVDLWNHASSKE